MYKNIHKMCRHFVFLPKKALAFMKDTKSLFYRIMSLACICMAALSSVAQSQPVALGQWRIHLPYFNVEQICETPNEIYCATAYGMFSFNKFEGNTERLSPSNGFSGYKAEAMAYDWNNDVLIIAYKDGKLDLVKNKSIDQNLDIYNKTIVGSKKINHINIVNGMAYISTSFGLLEFNLIKNETKNSYLNIGPLGSTIEILASSILNDSLYISTKNGIYAGKMSNTINLADYNNWHLSLKANIRSKAIASYNNRLIAECDSQLYQQNNGQWQPFLYSNQTRIIKNIEVQHEKLIIGAFGDSIFCFANGFTPQHKGINELSDCMIDQNGQYWYSSNSNGLVLMHPNGEINYSPNGPRAVTAYQFINVKDKLYTMAGGFMPTINAPTFNGNKYYTFDNYEWRSAVNSPIIYPMYDFVTAAYQSNADKLYIGSFGKGILEMQNGEAKVIYDESNTPLKKQGDYTIVRGLALDNKDNLWVSNYNVDSALLRKSGSGAWSSFKLPVNKVGKIVIDNKGNKWILTPKEACGILAFNEKNLSNPNDDVAVQINTNKGNGNLPTNAVNDIAFTKSGELLIGTDQGYVKMRSPNNAFTGGDYDAQSVIVSVDANSNLGGKLLETEVINCITIDGADRRWFGTDKGAWLYDSDGETLIHHFTTDNSPLMSNNVLNIGIMQATGEVFFGTEDGIASYRADALPANKQMGEISIFPNPVKPNFNGTIGITGMPDNSLVKITDINGQLVYQTFSNGSMATWNGHNFAGQFVSSGVYLVFCIDSAGTETNVGKILVVH